MFHNGRRSMAGERPVSRKAKQAWAGFPKLPKKVVWLPKRHIAFSWYGFSSPCWAHWSLRFSLAESLGGLVDRFRTRSTLWVISTGQLRRRFWRLSGTSSSISGALPVSVASEDDRGDPGQAER